MHIRIIHGATGAYACIRTLGYALDVLLTSGMSPAQSLRQSAAAIRADADARMLRAHRMELAAGQLEREREGVAA